MILKLQRDGNAVEVYSQTRSIEVRLVQKAAADIIEDYALEEGKPVFCESRLEEGRLHFGHRVKERAW